MAYPNPWSLVQQLLHSIHQDTYLNTPYSPAQLAATHVDNVDLVKFYWYFPDIPGSIWGIIWVQTFHLAIACIRLGGSLTPPSFSYLRVVGLGGFLLWVSVLSPHSFTWCVR